MESSRTLQELKNDRDIWSSSLLISALCSQCNGVFDIKYGTLYNVIRRNADGIYCNRKCAGQARSTATQKRYNDEGGKLCKRCGEFKELELFSSLPSPPFFRAECKRCHNYKPARQFSLYRDKASRLSVPFSINLEEFLVFWGTSCHYCNSEVSTIRLELVESSIGYLTGNMVSCCRNCQKFKGNLKHSEFIDLCNKISLNVKVNYTVELSHE